MSREDYLAILGLAADANWSDVLDAYEDLCTVWAPERFSSEDRLNVKPGEKLKEIHRAFEFLSADDVLRARSSFENNDGSSAADKGELEAELARAFKTEKQKRERQEKREGRWRQQQVIGALQGQKTSALH